MRQLHVFLERIIIRKHNEHAQVAALHGIELELKQVQRQVEEFTEEQKRKFSDVIKKAVKRNMKDRLGVENE